jgi:hypothetical protein
MNVLQYSVSPRQLFRQYYAPRGHRENSYWRGGKKATNRGRTNELLPTIGYIDVPCKII